MLARLTTTRAIASAAHCAKAAQGSTIAAAMAVNSNASSFHSSAPKKGLTLEQEAIVKSTAPVLAQHGTAITTHFYKRMLNNHPELRNVFNAAHQNTGTQPAALAHAVWAYAENIDNLGALTTAVSRIGHKHASLGITPDQYPIVGENLLASLKEVLGDAITDPIVDAWGAAYQQLADIFINFERDLYQKAEQTPEAGTAGASSASRARCPKATRSSPSIWNPSTPKSCRPSSRANTSRSGCGCPSWAYFSHASTVCPTYLMASTSGSR